MSIRWITGDVFDGLAQLEDGSVDLVVTSPPFLALRSYLPADHPDKSKEIGSEATPAEFIDTMLAVTAELRRVLAPHGSICVELGDTYAHQAPSGNAYGAGESSMTHKLAGQMWNSGESMPVASIGEGWPLAKSRTLIPQLYEIALAYGINPLTGTESPAGQWRIRNVVTWARPNPPVGALGDKWRPATSDVVVACTSPKRYWDDLATRQPAKTGDRAMFQSGSGTSIIPGNSPRYRGDRCNACNGTGTKTHDPDGIPNRGTCSKCDGTGWIAGHVQKNNAAGAPLLDYWEIPPGGYKGAHYAVFPPALVEPLVKAMCPEKVCRACGEPSRRIVEAEQYYRSTGEPVRGRAFTSGASYAAGRESKQHGVLEPLGHDSSVERRVTSQHWTNCGHDDYRPGIVLDPFAGSGTTLAVASGHGHDAIGIDLDPRNEDLARERIGPLLFEVLM